MTRRRLRGAKRTPMSLRTIPLDHPSSPQSGSTTSRIREPGPHQGLSCRNQHLRVAFPSLPALPLLPDPVDPDAWLQALHGHTLARKIGSDGCVWLWDGGWGSLLHLACPLGTPRDAAAQCPRARAGRLPGSLNDQATTTQMSDRASASSGTLHPADARSSALRRDSMKRFHKPVLAIFI
jgi:hypothetical protein